MQSIVPILLAGAFLHFDGEFSVTNKRKKEHAAVAACLFILG
jgi:hypothetical protein